MPDAGYPDPGTIVQQIIEEITIEPPDIPTFAFAELPLEEGWQAFGEGWAGPSYWVDPFGIAHLRGRIITVPPRDPGDLISTEIPPTAGGFETFMVAGSGGPTLLSISDDGWLIYSLGDPTSFSWADLSGITYPFAP